MAGTALVTGSADRVQEVAAAFEKAGITAVGVSDLAEVPKTVEHASVDYYVQLPVTLQPDGNTVTERVRHFLAAGLLARFEALESVLPHLTQEATVVLVAGNLLPQASLPDDHDARIHLLRVLGQAVRADEAPNPVRVRVLSHQHSPDEVVRIALTGEQERTEAMYDLDERSPNMSYADWRTEILGLASVET